MLLHMMPVLCLIYVKQYMDMLNEVLLWLVAIDVFEHFVVLAHVI